MNLEDFLNEEETALLDKKNKKLSPGQWSTAIDRIVRIFQEYEPLNRYKLSAKIKGSLVTFRAGNTIIGKLNVNDSSVPDERLDIKKTQLEELL